MLLSVAAWSGSLAARQAPPEYDVKAVFVLNFVRYVEWPADRRRPPLRICVLERNPFGDRLASVVQGEPWHGGSIEVSTVADMSRATECHLLYVPVTARFNSSPLVGKPILTVGEHEQFLERGGMIRLFLEDNKVRFSINQRAAESVGLVISSRLLRLARNVIGTASR
jgi:hypothetical protein